MFPKSFILHGVLRHNCFDSHELIRDRFVCHEPLYHLMCDMILLVIDLQVTNALWVSEIIWVRINFKRSHKILEIILYCTKKRLIGLMSFRFVKWVIFGMRWSWVWSIRKAGTRRQRNSKHLLRHISRPHARTYDRRDQRDRLSPGAPLPFILKAACLILSSF